MKRNSKIYSQTKLKKSYYNKNHLTKYKVCLLNNTSSLLLCSLGNVQNHIWALYKEESFSYTVIHNFP